MLRSATHVALVIATTACHTTAVPRAPAARQPAIVVLNKGEATAWLVSQAEGTQSASMPVGDAPHEVAVSPDGNWAVAANYGARTPGHTLTLLDLRARRAANTIDLGGYLRPHGIAWLPDGRRVVVTSEQARAVAVVDVFAGQVERAIVTNQPGHLLALSKDGRFCWTANIATGSVSLIDVDKGQVVKMVVTGKGPEAIDVSPDGRELWTADRELNRITVLAASTLDSVASIPTGELPNRLHFTPDGRWVLVSNIRSGTVTVIDAKDRRAIDTIVFPSDFSGAGQTARSAAQPEGILIAPDGKTAWVALAGANQIAELDIASRKVIRYLTTGREPDGMSYVPAVPQK